MNLWRAPSVGDDSGEGFAVAVAPGVVGHDPFDVVDAVGGEVVDGAGEERGAGVGLLVVVDLGVGEAAVVIDEGVDVVVAEPVVLRPLWLPMPRGRGLASRRRRGCARSS